MPAFPEHAQLANLALMEELYAKYLGDPASVDPSWRHFFEGIDFASFLSKKETGAPLARIANLVQSYRKFGHLKASFNPLEAPKEAPELSLEALGFLAAELDQKFPTLGFCQEPEAPLKEIIGALESVYCSRIGFEFDLGNPELEKWIQSRIEPELHLERSAEEKLFILESLSKAEIFETFLHTKYVGQTRFSLEGAETMIPMLAQVFNIGSSLEIDEFLIGMAHRGRLNVLTNLLNKPLSFLLQEFEDDTTLSFSGNDDVKYHMGFTGEWTGPSNKKITVRLAANPSHLESVDPVVLGQTYARQIQKQDEEKRRTCPILIHGDASLAGQGVVYEALQLMHLPGYSTGGTIHLVVNNQIGYTTLPHESRSTLYCTDIARTYRLPVFHVNAEDPESCLFAAQLAVEIRQKFHVDVFLDLLCYRKYGHNEGDEPSFTQPLQYKAIRAKKPIRRIYAEAAQIDPKTVDLFEARYKEMLTQVKAQSAEPVPTIESEDKPTASIDGKKAVELFCQIPAGFQIHPKLQKWVQERVSAVEKGVGIDWSTGECMAFGSLLMQGFSVRLAGQDAQRGTFSQRHFVWTDYETGKLHFPLRQLKGRLDVINSPLTEFAGLGFEYGYSWMAFETLVLWEAQYGDFDNGAQVIIDQYIASGEQKWNTPSSIVLLLPHAYEGAGPEHSSARLERFLQLAANQNMTIANATTPSQYFHLLRRQMLARKKKPLILFTPKSLLRSALCTSKMEDFTNGSFQEFLEDPKPFTACRRLIFCTGKIFYDLLAEREKKNISDIVLIRVEQIYPLREEKLKNFLDRYKGFKELCWVQEEPENMGAWNFIKTYLPNARYIGRAPNATTATGSHKKHKQEQQELLDLSMGGS